MGNLFSFPSTILSEEYIAEISEETGCKFFLIPFQLKNPLGDNQRLFNLHFDSMPLIITNYLL